MITLREIGVFAFFFLPQLIWAQSIEENVESSMALEMEMEMTVAELEGKKIQTFHQRAQQKLLDFADVLTLLSDPSLEIPLRNEVVTSALDLFENDQVVVQWYDLESGQAIELPILSFLEKLKKESQGFNYEFLEIKGSPPEKCPAQICEWELHFQIEQKGKSEQTIFSQALMTVVLKRATKEFGATTKEVWGIFLGELKIHPKRP